MFSIQKLHLHAAWRFFDIRHRFHPAPSRPCQRCPPLQLPFLAAGSARPATACPPRLLWRYNHWQEWSKIIFEKFLLQHFAPLGSHKSKSICKSALLSNILTKYKQNCICQTAYVIDLRPLSGEASDLQQLLLCQVLNYGTDSTNELSSLHSTDNSAVGS